MPVMALRGGYFIYYDFSNEAFRRPSHKPPWYENDTFAPVYVELGIPPPPPTHTHRYIPPSTIGFGGSKEEGLLTLRTSFFRKTDLKCLNK